VRRQIDGADRLAGASISMLIAPKGIWGTLAQHTDIALFSLRRVRVRS
jgi:hypothetical protein